MDNSTGKELVKGNIVNQKTHKTQTVPCIPLHCSDCILQRLFHSAISHIKQCIDNNICVILYSNVFEICGCLSEEFLVVSRGWLDFNEGERRNNNDDNKKRSFNNYSNLF